MFFNYNFIVGNHYKAILQNSLFWNNDGENEKTIISTRNAFKNSHFTPKRAQRETMKIYENNKKDINRAIYSQPLYQASNASIQYNVQKLWEVRFKRERKLYITLCIMC